MSDFMKAGGFAMWPVLALGLVTLAAAIRMAVKPLAAKPVVIKSLTIATLFTSLAGSLTGFAAVMSKVPGNPEWANSPDLPLIVMIGLGEASGSLILGCSFLGIAWIFVSIGSRRLANQLG